MGKLVLLSRVVLCVVLLIVLGYVGLNFALSDAVYGAGSTIKLILTTMYFTAVGAAVGLALPKMWWMAVIANWGAGVVATIALTYSMTHLSGILMSLWPAGWVVSSVVTARLTSRVKLSSVKLKGTALLRQLLKLKNIRIHPAA